MKKMKNKRIIMLAILGFAAVRVYAFDYAYNKGDLLISLDPQVGYIFSGNGPSYVGWDLRLTGNAAYYFNSNFSVNAGMGLEMIPGEVYEDGGGSGYDSNKATQNAASSAVGGGGGGSGWGPKMGDLTTLYLSIPFGVRLSLGYFYLGAGLKGNIPMYCNGEFNYTDYEHDGQGYGLDGHVKANPYMSCYLDIGVDFTRKGYFGIVLQMGTGFTDKVIDVPASKEIKYSDEILTQSRAESFSISHLHIGLLVRVKIPMTKISFAGDFE